jgi:hypothetical protein
MALAWSGKFPRKSRELSGTRGKSPDSVSFVDAHTMNTACKGCSVEISGWVHDQAANDVENNNKSQFLTVV